VKGVKHLRLTKSKAKKTTVKTNPRLTRKRTSKKLLSTHSESGHDDSEGSPMVFQRKKNNEEQGRQKTSTGRHCTLSWF